MSGSFEGTILLWDLKPYLWKAHKEDFALFVSFTDIVRARPDSHAPIGVIGEHRHKVDEMMQISTEI